MRLIQIINGIYGHRRKGKGRPEPMSVSSPPFSLEDEEAARLVALRVAAYMDGNSEVEIRKSEVDEPVDMPEDEPEEEGFDVPEYSVEMSTAELKKLMEDCGFVVKANMTKAAMVAALDEFFADDQPPEDHEALGPVV